MAAVLGLALAAPVVAPLAALAAVLFMLLVVFVRFPMECYKAPRQSGGAEEAAATATTSGADGAYAAGDCEAGEAGASHFGGTDPLSFPSSFPFRAAVRPNPSPFLFLTLPLSLSPSLLVSKTQMGVPRRRRRRRASRTASRRRCCSPPASRRRARPRTWWAQREGMSGAAGCGCGDAAVLVCRARRRRRHAGRRGGDSRCCGLLRFVFGALRLWGLRPLRLTGTALDGCQGLTPAQISCA